MSDCYESKWVRRIVELQQANGSWGCFHSLAQPTKAQPMTTEQALRRLRILGLTMNDEPVKRALLYLHGCLSGKHRPPDRRERVLNWDAFEAHMLAAWMRLFVPDDALAFPIAMMWAEIITLSFKDGVFDEAAYANEYRKRIPVLHYGERLIAISQFYMVNLLKGLLDPETERRFVDHIINNPGGMYYVYDKRIADLPVSFESRQTSSWLAALEHIAGYSCAKVKLSYAVKWILEHKDTNGEWDMGASAKDGVYFPVADSWRRPEDRKADCTARVNSLLKLLS